MAGVAQPTVFLGFSLHENILWCYGTWRSLTACLIWHMFVWYFLAFLVMKSYLGASFLDSRRLEKLGSEF